MAEINNKPEITNDEVVNKVRKAIGHRATWMGLMLDEAKKAGDDYETMGRKAVSRCGHFDGKNICAAKASDSVKDFQAAFLDEFTQKLFEMDITECTDDELKVEFHYCALVDAWLKQGFDQETIKTLCDVAMDGDRQIAAENGLEFTLGETIAAGDSICSLCFKKNKR
jgi:hypothetical protein